MNYQRQNRGNKSKKLTVPQYSPLRFVDISSYLYQKLFFAYKNGEKKIERKNMNHIATFAVAKEEPTYYEFWVFLRIITPDVILKMNSEDFVTLFDLMKDNLESFTLNTK